MLHIKGNNYLKIIVLVKKNQHQRVSLLSYFLTRLFWVVGVAQWCTLDLALRRQRQTDLLSVSLAWSTHQVLGQLRLLVSVSQKIKCYFVFIYICIYVSVYDMHMNTGTCRSQKASDPLKLELEELWAACGCQELNWVLCENRLCSKPLSHLYPQGC